MKLDPTQKKLLLVFGLFFAPLALAATWYSLLPENYKPGSMTNNGNLIEPIYPVQAFAQTTKDGKEYTGKDLERKWTLVHLVNGVCEEACSKSLYNTRQIRIALAEDMDRVQRLTVIDNPDSAAANTKMWESHPDMTVIVGSSGGLAEQIRSHTQAQNYPATSVYLIDPLGNLMMQFPPELDPKRMMKDIEKLLRLSHIG